MRRSAVYRSNSKAHPQPSDVTARLDNAHIDPPMDDPQGACGLTETATHRWFAVMITPPVTERVDHAVLGNVQTELDEVERRQRAPATPRARTAARVPSAVPQIVSISQRYPWKPSGVALALGQAGIPDDPFSGCEARRAALVSGRGRVSVERIPGSRGDLEASPDASVPTSNVDHANRNNGSLSSVCDHQGMWRSPRWHESVTRNGRDEDFRSS